MRKFERPVLERKNYPISANHLTKLLLTSTNTKINADKNDVRNAEETVEKERAAETRKRVMETYGERRKRKKEEGDDSPSPSPSVKRRSGTETLRYLMEKTEQAKEHEDNLKLKTDEISPRCKI